MAKVLTLAEARRRARKKHAPKVIGERGRRTAHIALTAKSNLEWNDIRADLDAGMSVADAAKKHGRTPQGLSRTIYDRTGSHTTYR